MWIKLKTRTSVDIVHCIAFTSALCGGGHFQTLTAINCGDTIPRTTDYITVYPTGKESVTYRLVWNTIFGIRRKLTNIVYVFGDEDASNVYITGFQLLIE